MKNWIKQQLNKLPHVRSLYLENKQWKKYSRVPPGHYYSPIVNVPQIKEKEDVLWGKKVDQIKGIRFNDQEQLQLLKDLSHYYQELPFTEQQTDELRYYFNNTFYSYTDAIVLYAMIRHYKPKNIIELGSGFSSAVMMDVNEKFFSNAINLTFIEPYPKRLNSLLKEGDNKKHKIIVQDAQKIDLDVFKVLEKGDILFIDSTHVAKTGSDVNYILFSILPSLKKGVLIHFHDIFFPFEYPKKWVYQGNNWNEIYFLQSFLMYNDTFKIKLFSHYMHRFYKEAFNTMPLTYKNTGGNLWLEKIK